MPKFSYTNRTSRLTVRISPDLHKRLRDYCLSFSVSQCETIQKAIEAYLGDFEATKIKGDKPERR